VRAGDHETAKQCWTRLLDQNPPAEIRDVIKEQLASLGGAEPGVTVPAGTRVGAQVGPVAPRGRTIEIHVTLDPALASRLKPGVPLFVSARQPGIPGPPLAALRLEASQLPLTVTLSDANAMIEGRDLSSVDDVEVTARIAFSGSVMSSSGDLVGSAMARAGHKDMLAIEIARVQP
jgi:cytochrome c-type biogenesis protein CcmH